ncbi:hypothetical protein J6590_072545 [Homalodisca vitripennis]|nr:hypothetical protein J6590_072545 [Homalodisca vitripennis]
MSLLYAPVREIKLTCRNPSIYPLRRVADALSRGVGALMPPLVDGVMVSIGNSGTRKRQASGGKRKEAKRKRYSAPSGSNVYIPCKHSTKTLSCSDIRPNDVKKLRDKLYKVPEKLRQDSILSSLVVTKNVKRRRPNMPNQNKSLSTGS